MSISLFYFFMSFFFLYYSFFIYFFFSSRRRHTRCLSDWSSDVCSSDLEPIVQQVAAAPQLHHKIIYPADGTVMALDPDIPTDRQKVFFEAKPADKNFKWLLDDLVIGNAGAAVSWSPRAGNHSLVLVDGDNRVVDRITFSVRGRIGELSQEVWSR